MNESGTCPLTLTFLKQNGNIVNQNILIDYHEKNHRCTTIYIPQRQ